LQARVLGAAVRVPWCLVWPCLVAVPTAIRCRLPSQSWFSTTQRTLHSQALCSATHRHHSSTLTIRCNVLRLPQPPMPRWPTLRLSGALSQACALASQTRLTALLRFQCNRNRVARMYSFPARLCRPSVEAIAEHANSQLHHPLRARRRQLYSVQPPSTLLFSSMDPAH
jgi:hypothetical protein